MLENKVVVITGASAGLGKSIALKLSKEKAKIALVARREDKLREVKSEIEQQGGVAEYFVCDISDPSQVENSVNKIIQKFSTIDILINNAGIYYQQKFTDHTPEKIQQLVTTNTIGPMLITRAVLPIFQKNNSGQILNVISVAGVDFEPDYIIYTATKHALRGFTESLIKELSKTKIKVMAIYPAGIDTDIFSAANIQLNGIQPWMMKKEDVAEVVQFMLTRPDDILLNHVEIRKII